MANDLVTYTENFGFALVARTQDGVKYLDFRDLICGIDDSNMMKIDTALAQLRDSIYEYVKIDETELNEMLAEVLV